MPDEPEPRPLDVRTDLIAELECRAELLFASKKAVEVQPDRVAVDVRIEVQDVALDRRREVFVKRGANADVRHALERARETLEPRGRDVNARAGEEIVGR